MSDLVTRLSVLAEDDGDRYPAHVKKLAEATASRIAALEAQLAEARKALEAVQEADVRVKPLEWEEVTAARSNEDPRREPTGDYEAVSPIGVYYIEQYFRSDSYGWRVTLHGSDDVADKDDPDEAKAAAQADYERRILSALEPAAPEGRQDSKPRARAIGRKV